MYRHPSGLGGMSAGKAGTESRSEKAGMHKRPEWREEADKSIEASEKGPMVPERAVGSPACPPTAPP